MSITGDRMRERRKQLNINADTLAEYLGVSRTTVFRYENGDIDKVPAKLLTGIAKFLKTSEKYLMGWEDNPEVSSSNTSPLILDYYELLNDTGKHEATKRVKELTELSQYTNSLNDFNEELASEFIPDNKSNMEYVVKNKFNNIEDAKGYLYSQQLLAGLDSGNVTESDLIKIANKIYANNTQERRL